MTRLVKNRQQREADRQRQRIVTAAEGWLGTPYHHEAAIQGAGVDCAMLLAAVYHEAGSIPAIDPRPYPHDWHLHRSEERYLGWLTDYAHEVTVARPGDVALFRFGRCFSHAAIVTLWPQVIHAYIGQGVFRADATQPPLAGRAIKVFSVIED